MITSCLVSYCKSSKKQPHPPPFPKTTQKKRRNIRNIPRCQTTKPRVGSFAAQWTHMLWAPGVLGIKAKTFLFGVVGLGSWDPNQVVIPFSGQVPKTKWTVPNMDIYAIYLLEVTKHCYKHPRKIYKQGESLTKRINSSIVSKDYTNWPQTDL